MNMTLIWIFAGYFILTIAINGAIAYLSKKLIGDMVKKYPGCLEKIVDDPGRLSLMKKGYFLQSMDKNEVQAQTDEALSKRFGQILPMVWLAYSFMAGLVIFLIIMVIVMNGVTPTLRT